jgi:hypothetical protein
MLDRSFAPAQLPDGVDDGPGLMIGGPALAVAERINVNATVFMVFPSNARRL